MLGLMTTELSKEIAKRLAWVDILSTFPPVIRWNKIPRGKDDSPPPVPCLPWMFGYASNYLSTLLHWWEEPETDVGKPAWWFQPVKEVRISDYLPHFCAYTSERNGCMQCEYRETFSGGMLVRSRIRQRS